MLSSGEPSAPHLDFLLRHSVKMLNIYYHLVTNQRHPPPTSSHSGSSSSSSGSSKPPKSELFAREQPAASLQALGYFAGDYVYMKLYNILRGANDSYKVSQATDSRIQSEQPPLSRWRRNGKSCAARALRFASNPATQHPSIEHPGFSFRWSWRWSSILWMHVQRNAPFYMQHFLPLPQQWQWQ